MTMHRGIIRQSNFFFHVDAHLGFICQCYDVTRNIYIPGKTEIKNYTFRKMCLCTCLSTPCMSYCPKGGNFDKVRLQIFG